MGTTFTRRTRIIRFFLLVSQLAAGTALLQGTYLHAQAYTMVCGFPPNTQISLSSGLILSPASYVEGQAPASATIGGVQLLPGGGGDGCTDLQVYYPGSQYATIQTAYYDSTRNQIHFTISFAPGTPIDDYQLNLAGAFNWIISVRAPSPPSPPQPPRPGCPDTSITSVDKPEWPAGETMPITIHGTGFTCNGISNIIVTPTVQGSTVDLDPNWRIINDSEIDAKVTPDSNDPTQTVNIALYGGPILLLARNPQSGFALNDNDTGPSGSPLATGQAKIKNPEITVIAWVNGNAPDIQQALSVGPSTVALLLSLTGNPLMCGEELLLWAHGVPANLNTPLDVYYANSWLLYNTRNNAPPPVIVPKDQLSRGDFRLFNDFGGGKHFPATVGRSINPCIRFFPTVAAQASPYNNATDPSGNKWQLVEGRVGPTGQAINATINNQTTPWIWSVIEFDSSKNPATNNHAMFPTYYVYEDGKLKDVYPQSAAASFIVQGEGYQMTPGDIQ